MQWPLLSDTDQQMGLMLQQDAWQGSQQIAYALGGAQQWWGHMKGTLGKSKMSKPLGQNIQ